MGPTVTISAGVYCQWCGNSDEIKAQFLNTMDEVIQEKKESQIQSLVKFYINKVTVIL